MIKASRVMTLKKTFVISHSNDLAFLCFWSNVLRYLLNIFWVCGLKTLCKGVLMFKIMLKVLIYL